MDMISFVGAGEMYYYVVFNGFHVTEQKITSYSKNDKASDLYQCQSNVKIPLLRREDVPPQSAEESNSTEIAVQFTVTRHRRSILLFKV